MPRRRARRGTGSVYYSKSERTWVASYPTGEVRNGRQVRAKRWAATSDEADYELDKLRDLYSAKDPATMTMEQYLTDWIAGYRSSIAPSTAKAYEGHIKHYLIPHLGRMAVSDLEPPDVRRLTATLAKTLGPASVVRVLATLSCAMQQLVDDRKLKDNPVRGVRRPKVPTTLVEPMTVATRDAILAAVKADMYGPLYRLLLGSGMRVGEAIGLNWADLHLDDKFVTVRISKTGARAVPITDDAVAALRSLAPSRPGDPVFLGVKSGRRLDATTATHHFVRVLEANMLPRMRIHDLRHGVATMMLSSGAPMKVISEQLGHRTAALTQKTYAHVVPQVQREALDKIGSGIGSGGA